MAPCDDQSAIGERSRSEQLESRPWQCIVTGIRSLTKHDEQLGPCRRSSSRGFVTAASECMVRPASSSRAATPRQRRRVCCRSLDQPRHARSPSVYPRGEHFQSRSHACCYLVRVLAAAPPLRLSTSFQHGQRCMIAAGACPTPLGGVRAARVRSDPMQLTSTASCAGRGAREVACQWLVIAVWCEYSVHSDGLTLNLRATRL